jgi:hypothetical protein
MLQRTKAIIEDPDRIIAISPKFDKLITALRTAVAQEYKLDKTQTSYHDSLYSLRLSLSFFKAMK